METKENIKKIVEKEVLSFWDFKTLLEYIADALQHSEKHEDCAGLQLLSTNVGKELQSYIETITHHITSISKSLIKFQEDIIEEFNNAYYTYEKQWSDFYNRKQNIDKQMGKIEFPELKLPYNWKEYIELSEKLAAMTNEQREALANFYKLLNK